MTEQLTRQRISDVVDPLGWRLILGVAVTHVRVPTLAAAAEAAAVAISTDGVDGHLTVDLHADRLVLRVHTVDAGSVTEPDLELVARVTAALVAHGLHTQPAVDDVAPQTFEIAVDAVDIPLVRPFWKAVTGYVEQPAEMDLPDGGLVDPLRRGPAIWFQQMDEPRIERNRIHLDVDVPPELARPRVDAALAAGGTLKSDAAAPAFWVLADPEGNEVCVCTWQGRD
ncbi:VOC family protein [Mycobacterium sp. AT1]|uniref:VOC family protein n=1 Tax=Mycobacterium sp. AT1 TaxID=1961706 RepID=UPI0009ADBEDF|nr:VOC family protein [Mycobacterium sp. AT1]OPX10863.1 4a-hydroxytetrahydrobiopterin dehydratase [Mycobacterium sp. AT1]